jgi:hypothetical protein
MPENVASDLRGAMLMAMFDAPNQSGRGFVLCRFVFPALIVTFTSSYWD